MKIFIANFFIISSCIVIMLYGINQNNNFINIIKIFKDHFKIFGGANKHIIIIYGMPIIMSIGIALQYYYTNSLIEAIMVVISVVISSLLAFQGSILNKKGKNRIELDIIDETNSSINFVVLINIISVFFMLIYMVVTNQIIKQIFTGIITYQLLITFFTILIIMKRLRVLLKEKD